MLNSSSESVRKSAVACCFVFTICFVYSFGLDGGYLFDDYSTIVDNPKLHLSELSGSGLWEAAFSFEPGGGGRPLAMASFALNYLMTGLDPWGFKFTNLLIHCVNALLVVALICKLLQLFGVKRYVLLVSIVAGLFWAVHPLQVSSVLYVVQRMEILAHTFVLVALLCYLAGRNRQLAGRLAWPYFLLCVLFTGVGLLCKETAILVPGYTVLLELFIFKGCASNPLFSKMWRYGYVGACVISLATYTLWVVPHYGSLDDYATRSFNTVERLLTQARVLVLYMQQIFFPLPSSMGFYYDDFTLSRGLFNPISTFWSLLALGCVLVVGWLVRNKMPLASLGILWFFCAHFLSSNVVPLELAFEHRNYFAILGAVLVLVAVLQALPVRDGPGIKIFGAALAITFVGFLGGIRAATWGDELLLATSLADYNPSSPRAAHALGVKYYEMSGGDVDSPFYSFAQRQFEKESGLTDFGVLGEQSLILMGAATGSDVQRWQQSLLAKLSKGKITPETTHAMFALLQNRYQEAFISDQFLVEAFQELFAYASFPPNSYVQVARYTLMYTNNEEAAANFLMQAVNAGHDYPEYINQVINNVRGEGYTELANILRAYARQAGVLQDALAD